MKRKQTRENYEPAVYHDDPDAIATVNVFDAERDEVIPVEVGYYYHGKSGSTLFLLGDPRSKQLLWEASQIQLTRFSRSKPSAKHPQRTAQPAASYRPVASPVR
ncbi:MAG: hypothetical protein CMJ58_11365 [Planctomycetaceae bacterium]|nr:hypothetical protein [Planctomycetaceae bacterium]